MNFESIQKNALIFHMFIKSIYFLFENSSLPYFSISSTSLWGIYIWNLSPSNARGQSVLFGGIELLAFLMTWKKTGPTCFALLFFFFFYSPSNVQQSEQMERLSGSLGAGSSDAHCVRFWETGCFALMRAELFADDQHVSCITCAEVWGAF